MKFALAVLVVAPFLAVANPAIMSDLYDRLMSNSIFSSRRMSTPQPPRYAQPPRYISPVSRPPQPVPVVYLPPPGYGPVYSPGVPVYSNAPTYAPAYNYNAQMISNAFGNFGGFRPLPGYGQPQPQPQPQKQEESHGHSHNMYEDPASWPQEYPECGGQQQSPIDINIRDLQSRTYPALVRENFWYPPTSMTLENNGHTIEVAGVWPKGKEPTVRGGPLDSKYAFKQLHLHWGLNDLEGSEHTVNGQRYPMELHCVMYNTKYGTYDNAIKNKDGLVVLGFFFDISPVENPMLEQFVQHVQAIRGSHKKEVEMSDPMPIGILNLEPNQWVTYRGSLTTPPCSEIVTWIVSTVPLSVSNRQMEILRNVVMEEGEPMHNYRPLQPLNGRQVFIQN